VSWHGLRRSNGTGPNRAAPEPVPVGDSSVGQSVRGGVVALVDDHPRRKRSHRVETRARWPAGLRESSRRMSLAARLTASTATPKTPRRRRATAATLAAISSQRRSRSATPSHSERHGDGDTQDGETSGGQVVHGERALLQRGISRSSLSAEPQHGHQGPRRSAARQRSTTRPSLERPSGALTLRRLRP